MKLDLRFQNLAAVLILSLGLVGVRGRDVWIKSTWQDHDQANTARSNAITHERDRELFARRRRQPAKAAVKPASAVGSAADARTAKQRPFATASASRYTATQAAYPPSRKKQDAAGARDDIRGLALMQKKAVRVLRRGLRLVEDDQEFIMGIPKIVWVIFATVLATGVWVGCVLTALHFARQPPKSMSMPRSPDELYTVRDQQAAAAAAGYAHISYLNAHSPAAYQPAYNARQPQHGSPQFSSHGSGSQSQIPGSTPTFFGGTGKLMV
jgi:hypothetical protein